MNTATLYVSRHCGACAKALQLLARDQRLLAKTDIKIMDDDPAARLAVHTMRARMTPVLVVHGPQGDRMFEGSQAFIEMVKL